MFNKTKLHYYGRTIDLPSFFLLLIDSFMICTSKDSYNKMNIQYGSSIFMISYFHMNEINDTIY